MIKHLLAILVASLTTTIFMMPISTTDALVVATLNSVSPFITIPLLVLVDMATAILAYNGATLLIGLLFKKQSKRDYIANIGAKLGNKRGYALIVIAAATPFPYTATLYAAGSIKWGNNFKIATGVGIGKLVRYSVIAIATFYGIKYDLFSYLLQNIEMVISIVSLFLMNYLYNLLLKRKIKLNLEG